MRRHHQEAHVIGDRLHGQKLAIVVLGGAELRDRLDQAGRREMPGDQRRGRRLQQEERRGETFPARHLGEEAAEFLGPGEAGAELMR